MEDTLRSVESCIRSLNNLETRLHHGNATLLLIYPVLSFQRRIEPILILL